MEQSSKWYKKMPNNIVWWLDNPDAIGQWIFSFDRQKEFNMFREYPYKLTPEQKEVFDKENPFWVDFFKDR